MIDAPEPSKILETAESTVPNKGRARCKARHLSQILRQVIVDEFLATKSSEDVAESLRIPARTVTDVILLDLLRMARKPVESERRLGLGAKRA